MILLNKVWSTFPVNFYQHGFLVKLDTELKTVWTRKLDIQCKMLQNLPANLIVDQNNDIVFCSFDYSSSSITFSKISSSGDEIFRKLLLDGQVTMARQLISTENGNIITAENVGGSTSKIIKLGPGFDGEYCGSINYCSGLPVAETTIENADLPLHNSDGNQTFVDGFSFEPIELYTEEVCTPSLPPNADFTINNQFFCLGEYIKFNLDSISAVGASTWEIVNPDTVYTIKTKYIEDIEINVLGKWTITHNLKLHNCDLVDTFSFEVQSPLDLDLLDNDYPICDTDSLEIFLSSQAADIVWSSGEISMVNVFSSPGQYYAEYKDSIGCQHREDFSIYQDFSPKVSLPADSSFCPGENYSLTLVGSDIDTFYWDNNFKTETINISSEGEYFITVENNCGIDTAIHIATFAICDEREYIPNIFTPNEDGINDFFEIALINQTIENCVIYDRWGSIVYQSTEQVKWDGKKRGSYVKQGVYLYKIDLVDDDGNSKLKCGSITVLR